ncbi:putative dimethylaniline monooxygenase (N-oxide-forming) [Auricularia subglabra TFB-10046 SS5]|nr:putative dimethylaniline monooxygenase (N-oxide-forming) [Auricularia subglabra TFB-10046 SS5]
MAHSVAVSSRPGSALSVHPDLRPHSQGWSTPPASAFTVSLPVAPPSPVDIASTWLRSLATVLQTPTLTLDALRDCFVNDCHWRDLLALSWDLHTITDIDQLAERLADWARLVRPRSFRLQPGADLSSPYPGLEYIHGSFVFETDTGMCSARFNLVSRNGTGWKGWTVVSTLDALKDRNADGMFAGSKASDDSERGPTVLIIGAGQCGLAAAARLKHLGISSVLVERSARLGDNWRGRYEDLRLNTPTRYSELPFATYPSSWPLWPSGHQLADELESYPHKLDLEVWTSTAVTSATYDAVSRTWRVELATEEAKERTVFPRHIVVATGIGTLSTLTPRVPDVAGQAQFSGTTMHSSQYRNGQNWAGKTAVVVGAACSGQDIAQDLCRKGARVTMIQRSPISVISRERLWALFNGEKLYGENSPIPTDTADRLVQSMPTEVSCKVLHPIEQKLKFMDQELFTGLQKQGFLLPDDSDSFLQRILLRRGGYYVNGGASDLIVQGKIKVRAAVQPVAFTRTGLVLSDGSELDADLVVFATGYAKNDLREYVRSFLGPEVARHVRATGQWDAERETSGIWRPCGHPGLWFAGGDLFAARFYSQLLALQIQAHEAGYVSLE